MKIKNIILIAVSFVAIIVTLIFVTLINKAVGNILGKQIGNLSQILAIPIIYYTVKLILNKSENTEKINSILPINKFAISQFLKYYSIGLMLSILTSFITFVVGKTMQFEIYFQNNLTYKIYISFIIMLCVGFMEELFFRGLIQQLLYNYFNSKLYPAIISAILFGLIHTQIFNDNNGFIYFIDIIVFGFFASLLFLKTKSLIPPIALHAAWNFADEFFLDYESKTIVYNSKILSQVQYLELGSTYISIAIFLILSIYLFKNLKNNNQFSKFN